MPGNRRRGITMNSEMLEQAKGQLGDTAQNISALTCAMIAQAEAMERIAVAMERQAAAQEKLTAFLGELIVGGWLRVEVADKAF